MKGRFSGYDFSIFLASSQSAGGKFQKRTELRSGKRSSSKGMRAYKSLAARGARGNMIAFLSAVTLGLVLAVLFFALKYTRMLGSNQEQRTAIEGAALQVANDISRIVYEDPNFGFVAISDFAPIGYDTKARDNQLTPVRGINTILGTVRLDMIIADAMGNSEMQTLAQADYQNAMKAVQSLQSELTDACSASPKNDHRDWDGNIINVTQDAVAAYNQNIIRMSGSQTALDPSSVKITLGILTNGASTNTAIPTPASYANVTAAQTKVDTFPNNQAVTCYKSFTNIPYGNGVSNAFVFCGVDNSLKLVDISQFTTNISGLPYALTSIVKVEGDQVYQADSQNYAATRVHSIACAQPASAGDPRPFPGAMVLGFPNGVMPEITSLNDILNKPGIAKIPMSVSTSTTGDTGNNPIVPAIGNPGVGTTGSIGGYHWLRRAGTKANVQSIINVFGQALTSVGGGGTIITGTGSMNTVQPGMMYVYAFDTTGNAQLSAQVETPSRQILESNHQLVGKSMSNVTSSNGNAYGVVWSDMVAFPGTLYGGSHAGEPLLGQTQASDWDGAGTSSGVPILSLGGLLGLVEQIVFPILSALSSLTSLIFGYPVSTADVVRGPHVVVPAPLATTRTPRDTYTQQGLAVDMEIPQVITPALW